jgi:hypothetical protein
MREVELRRHPCAHGLELPLPQRLQEIPLNDDPLTLPPGQTLIGKMLCPSPKRIPRLGAEPTERQRHRFPFNEAVIEPGRALRPDLVRQAEIGSRREHKGGPCLLRPAEAPDP